MKIRIDRLAALSRHMKKRKLGHDEFDFSVFKENDCSSNKNSCGSAGCMAGELPFLYPRYWKFSMTEQGYVVRLRGNSETTVDNLSEFFGIERIEAYHLFYPGEQLPDTYGGQDLREDSSKAVVVRNLDLFIRYAEIEKINDKTPRTRKSPQMH